jgi:WD40 repeat protein
VRTGQYGSGISDEDSCWANRFGDTGCPFTQWLFSPDGKVLVSGSRDRSMSSWEVTPEQWRGSLLRPC